MGRRGGKPVFLLDGRPDTKPVFETYAPQAKFFRQLAEAGTDVVRFTKNLGTGFAAPTWLAPDRSRRLRFLGPDVGRRPARMHR
ncbi:MAG: hypothetical protein JNL97_14835 [Verrucomicrobiales bacterium]|nr:hypothetical protein [Verrucomicrobiales bacterium]